MTAVVETKIWTSPFDGHRKEKKGIQHHQKLILHSSCHVSRVLLVATKVEQGLIRVVNKRLLLITGALIETTVTKRGTSCNYR